MRSTQLYKRSPLATTILLWIAFHNVRGQTNAITTSQFNNFRTAATLTETTLDTSNVKVSSFGKVATFPVDGYVFAQPLYVPGLLIGGVRTNVLYIATMHNTLFAFDADNPGRGSLFQTNLGNPVPAGLAGTCPNGGATGPELGVLGTPVADLGSGTIFLVSATPSGAGYLHRLLALDMLTGSPKLGSPVTISPSVPGVGVDSQGGLVTMNQQKYIQRPGLLLSAGTVYAGFSSCGPDPDPYHGWILGFNAATLQQTAVFNSSPNGQRNGIWQSGRGLVADATGFVYAFTGNGTHNGVTDFSDSVLKLSPTLTVVDWFTPANYQPLDAYDLDLSSSGPLYMADSNRIVGGGKEGVLYVLNASSLGKSGAPVQQFQATTLCQPFVFSGCYQIHSIAYWNSNSPMLYLWGVGDALKAFRVSGGTVTTTPASQTPYTAGYPGASLAVSSDGSIAGTGIVWAVTPLGGFEYGLPGVVRAYDATNVAKELWNSEQNPGRDALGQFSKWGQPVIANGKVFVPTLTGVVAYGVLSGPPAAPSNLSVRSEGSASGNVRLEWIDNSNNETGFRIQASTDNVQFTDLATVKADTVRYIDKKPARGTWYYRVQSFNETGSSAVSNTAIYVQNR